MNAFKFWYEQIMGVIKADPDRVYQAQVKRFQKPESESK